MGTAVRYYITRDDNRPVVRSIPVSMRPEPRALEDQICVEPEQTATPQDKGESRNRVAEIMRNAVRRSSAGKR